MDAALTDYARPGLMVSQVWPGTREREGETLRALESAIEHLFFQTLHMVDVPFPKERANVGELVRGTGLPVSYGLTRILKNNALNLAALDESLRRRSLDAHVAALDGAREVGARAVVVLSGDAPDQPSLRPEAIARLRDSLAELGEAAAEAPCMEVLIEPLDVEIHKKGALGYTWEAADLIGDLPNVGLCLDTSHMTLNKENIPRELENAWRHTGEFHFCNCVDTPGHALYGDYHVPFGPPGALDLAEVGAIMAAAVRMGYLAPEVRPRVFCEVGRQDGQSAEDLIAHCRHVLEGGWHAAQEHLRAGRG